SEICTHCQLVHTCRRAQTDYAPRNITPWLGLLMKTLIVGGSGVVGTLVAPILAQTHAIRIFDLRPPQDANIEHVPGDAREYADLAKAVAGMDSLVYMAMGSLDWAETRGVVSAFDLNIKALHLA